MDTLPAIRLPLHSYPGTELILPEGSQVLTPPQPAASTPLQRSHLLAAVQARLRQEKAEATRLSGRETFRVLLLLPDQTRRQTAARLTVDALLDLKEKEQGWSLEIVFGLGTHPPMQSEEIERMLGRERLQKLEQLGCPLQQQSTLCSLPLRPLTVEAPKQAAGRDGESGRSDVLIQVPQILWSCDMVVVAGDTDLHPYEGRAGSGGIHKMIAIGIGCLSTIRMTHSMDILTHPQTRPGEAKNHFVESVDHFATAIIDAIMPPKGNLHCAPLGISVVAREQDRVVAFWIGNHEEERAVLLEQLKFERTLELKNAIDFVIADTEPEKGTDLLAGARGLHFLCNYDAKDNPLLCERSRCRTAIMYNPCHQQYNANGIGNTGTVLHLKALQQFAHEAIRSRPKSNPPTPAGEHVRTQALELQPSVKAKVLRRWERYLNLVSREDEIFAALEQLLIKTGQGNASIDEVLEHVDAALPHSYGAHHHVLDGTRMHLLSTGVDAALLFFRDALDKLGFKGLGEGGQRALRLLSILRRFDQLLVATDNPSVLEFLSSERPVPGDQEQASTPGRYMDRPDPAFELVGLHGISLLEYSPQQTLDLAIERHRQLQNHSVTAPSGRHSPQPRIAFLRKPVILRRAP